MLREDFQGGEDVIETLASLTDEDKKGMGYSLPDLILDCQFEGSDCYYRYVNKTQVC